MSKEEQIKELAEFFMSIEIYDHRECVDCCKYAYNMCDDFCFSNKLATYLYDAGYRKQREGRWKGAGLGDYLCSVCWSVYSGGDKYNYCPNCGSRMKEGR